MRRAVVVLAGLTVALAGCSGEPEPTETVTVIAQPEPVETVDPVDEQAAVSAPQQAILDDWWASQSTEDQRVLCQYWTDVDGAAEEAAADFAEFDLPISETVFVEWVAATC